MKHSLGFLVGGALGSIPAIILFLGAVVVAASGPGTVLLPGGIRLTGGLLIVISLVGILGGGALGAFLFGNWFRQCLGACAGGCLGWLISFAGLIFLEVTGETALVAKIAELMMISFTLVGLALGAVLAPYVVIEK